jgi:16S rRNA (guanine966-N2)-methyltransferase
LAASFRIPGAPAKSAIRIPNSERKSKSETQNLRGDGFGIRYSFGFRVSDFGFGNRPIVSLPSPQLMRIIGGMAGGTILKVPKGFEVRPTPDLVRQAVFNSLGPRVEGARVLELFGGTGALSLECLSRGAAEALCIELSPKHARFIEQNCQACRLPAGGFQVRVQDVFIALPQLAATGRNFDLILADPPYGEKNIGKRSRSFAQQLLDDGDLPTLLAEDGLFILGHAKRDTLELPATWQETKILKHGDSWMRFLRR